MRLIVSARKNSNTYSKMNEERSKCVMYTIFSLVKKLNDVIRKQILIK